MGVGSWIIIIILGLLLVSQLKPDWYDASAGKAIDAGTQAIFDKDNVTEEEPIPWDLGLPFLTQDFIKCTSNNVCERLYSSDAYCDLESGHCFIIN